jgi:hypothetical protein
MRKHVIAPFVKNNIGPSSLLHLGAPPTAEWVSVHFGVESHGICYEDR